MTLSTPVKWAAFAYWSPKALLTTVHHALLVLGVCPHSAMHDVLQSAFGRPTQVPIAVCGNSDAETYRRQDPTAPKLV